MQNFEIQELILNDLDKNEVENLLERSYGGEHKEMDDSTLCLFDISSQNIDGLKSIIIQKDGCMYRSNQSTNQLVENYSQSFHSSHQMTCLIASELEIYQKVPYVVGERCIIPLDGYSKQPVTWIVLNHVAHTRYDKDRRVLHVTSNDKIVLTLMITLNVFNGQLKRAVEIREYKLTLHRGRMKEYRNFYREPCFTSPNVLSDEIKKVTHKCPTMDYIEADKRLQVYIETKRMKQLFGSDNPFYDDYLKLIK